MDEEDDVFQQFLELLEQHNAPDDASIWLARDELHIFWGNPEQPTREQLLKGIPVRSIIDSTTKQVIGLVLMHYSQCQIDEANEESERNHHLLH